MDMQLYAERFIRIGELIRLSGLSRSSIYEKQKKTSRWFDPSFPKSFRISARSVAWSYSQVHDWMNSQKEKSAERAIK